jgi:hypothetical protein
MKEIIDRIIEIIIKNFFLFLIFMKFKIITQRLIHKLQLLSMQPPENSPSAVITPLLKLLLFPTDNT